MKNIIKYSIICLIAMMAIPSVVLAHTISFETFGGTHIDDVEIEDGEWFSAFDYSAQKNGWYFNGWCFDQYADPYDYDKCDVNGNVYSSFTVYANFTNNVYLYAYNATTNQVDSYAGAVYEYDPLAPEGKDMSVLKNGILTIHKINKSKIKLSAMAEGGYKFVGWKVGYNPNYNPEDYNTPETVPYEQTELISTNDILKDWEDGRGHVTIYAVFEEDPSQNAELITEATARVTAPEYEAEPDTNILYDDTKYRVEFIKWTGTYNDCDYSVYPEVCTKRFAGDLVAKLYLRFHPKPGYYIDETTKFYVNGELGDVVENGDPIRSFDFRIELEDYGPIYKVLVDFNGGYHKGEDLGKVYEYDEVEYIVNEENFTENFFGHNYDSVLRPGTHSWIEYDFDGLEADGVRYNIGDTLVINKDMTVKYLWKKRVYNLTMNYNGGNKGGKPTDTIQTEDVFFTPTKEFFMNGVTAPSGKELDYIEVDGDKLPWNQEVEFVVQEITFKYIWKDKGTLGTSETPTVPVAPNLNDFKVSGGNTTSITLSWNRATTANRYYVYQSTDNKKWTRIATVSALTYTKNKLTTNKKYYYKIEAYTTGTDGKDKLVVKSKVLTTKTAPKAATLKIKSNTYNSVTFTVGKATGAKKFIIESSTDNKKFTTAKTATKAGKVTVSGLNTGTKYYFRLKVCNEYNICSAYSKTVNKKLELKKPTIKVSSKAKTKMTVKVPAVAGATGYEILRSLKKGSGYTTVADVKSTKSYTDTGLTSKKKYYYKVRAYRIVNGKKVYSAYSKVANAKVK